MLAHIGDSSMGVDKQDTGFRISAIADTYLLKLTDPVFPSENYRVKLAENGKSV